MKLPWIRAREVKVWRWFKPPLPVWGALAALLAVGAACSGTGGATGEALDGDGRGRGDLRIVVVTHGQSADPFWSVVSNGSHDAAADMGIRVEYQAPGSFDMVEMSNIIEAAVASRPDALVVSIPDADALEGSIRSAVNAGLPVLSINSGGDVYSDLGVLAHIGQSEYEAGVAAGEALSEAGVSMALCVNHEVGNVAQDLRCEGVADALGLNGGAVRVLAVDLADPEDAVERIRGALAVRSDVDGLVTLGPAAAGPALAAIEQGGGEGEIAFGAFDLSPEILEAIRDGRILFTVDQQQYLQGYLPIVLLTKYLETGTLPAGGIIRTGPALVTAERVEDVIRLTEEGIR